MRGRRKWTQQNNKKKGTYTSNEELFNTIAMMKVTKKVKTDLLNQLRFNCIVSAILGSFFPFNSKELNLQLHQLRFYTVPPINGGFNQVWQQHHLKRNRKNEITRKMRGSWRERMNKKIRVLWNVNTRLNVYQEINAVITATRNMISTFLF